MVSVIIPCWNIDETLNQLTQRCVQSIRETSDVELILIDNGSTCGLDFMRDEADIYLRNKENRGYVRAVNQGFKLSGGDWIVLGNNDYKMSPGWVEALQWVFSNCDWCGAVCPSVKGGITNQDIPWVEHGTMGGWFMIKREDFLKIGLWDERFFNLFGDFDYKYRMYKLGLAVFSTPHVEVEHYGGASISKYPDNDKDKHIATRLFLLKWKDDPQFKEYLKQTFGLETMIDRLSDEGYFADTEKSTQG